MTDLESQLPPEAKDWLTDARSQPVGEVFPAVGRKVGRAQLTAEWTTDQAVRALLLRGDTSDDGPALLEHRGRRTVERPGVVAGAGNGLEHRAGAYASASASVGRYCPACRDRHGRLAIHEGTRTERQPLGPCG